MSTKTARRGRAIATTSWLALGVAMAWTPALAQTAPAQGTQTSSTSVEDVVVVGVRASQQSANARKRNASTAVESIVADDVGAFPDRNLNEALSRVAGVALERDEYGDGSSITLRGNGTEDIRVELDGMGVTGGGMGPSRSAELTTLPADLIKSVDVIKGSTASMTEGGLGGSVQVTTRTGLDFRKPYLSLRLGARKNTLGTDWNPDVNLVASRKFFDDRLGVLFSVSHLKSQNITNQIENHQDRGGYQARLVDFDNSPEKTFEFNSSTAFSPAGETRQNIAVDMVMSNSLFTPKQILQMSEAAKTKADCLAAFPLIEGALPPGFASNQNAANARNRRVSEQQVCLSQWNDWLPQFMRQMDHIQYENRTSADLRFDYRVSDNLSVYIRGQKSDRKVARSFRPRNLGGDTGSLYPIGSNANTNTQYNAVSNPNGLWTLVNNPDGTQGRLAAPGAGVFILPGLQAFGNRPIQGIVSNIDPSTVKYDENHFVTEYVANNQTLGLDQRDEPFNYYQNYLQAGGEYDSDNLRMTFMVGKSTTDFDRIGTRTQRGFRYGSARFFVQPNGLWASEPLVPYDATDPDIYVQMIRPGASAEVVRSGNQGGYQDYAPAYTVNQRALIGAQSGVEYNAWLSETQETTAKFDLTYNFDESQPIFTRFLTGFNYRTNSGGSWVNPGGKVIKPGSPDADYWLRELTPDPNDAATATQLQRDANGAPIRNPAYVAPVILPRAFLRSTIRACEESTVAGAEPCNFGLQDNLSFSTARDQLLTITEDEMRQLVKDTFRDPDTKFFNGYPGAEGLSSWQVMDPLAIANLFPNANMDCVKVCTANDGNQYAQPFTLIDEKSFAMYAQLDFEHELPYGMLFNGNIGVRGVHTEVSGTGTLTITSRRVSATFDPLNPTAAGSTSDVSVQSETSITSSTRDYLPSVNAALWLMPDELVLRYYAGKNVSRPRIGDLLPSGTCIVDEREELGIDGFEDTCGRIGNPGLKPRTAHNQNLSVEWYPNRDTQISVAKFIQDEKIGDKLPATASGYLFRGSGVVDPVTGDSLDDTLFEFPTWTNGPGIRREGWELTAKTAFTFLPWILRHTGADFNYSKVKGSAATGVGEINLYTGEVMPPSGQADFFSNLSVWYDDGRTNVRISAQKKAEFFNTNEGDGGDWRRMWQYQGSLAPRDFALDNPWMMGQSQFIAETLYVDAKISHKLRPDLEVFAEARNLTKEARSTPSKGGPTFADGTPNIQNVQYGGQMFTVGLTYRYGGN